MPNVPSSGCLVCGEMKNPMKRCTRCQITMYCSRECQMKDWSEHRNNCIPATITNDKNKDISNKEIDTGSNKTDIKTDIATATIIVKGNKTKYKIDISDAWSGEEILNAIVKVISIPLDKLKLIHKGKKMDADVIRSTIIDKAIYQAIGEKNEDETGLDVGDILTLMKQMSVDRNTAVKALRQSDTGDLVEAIIWLGNK